MNINKGRQKKECNTSTSHVQQTEAHDSKQKQI